MDAATITSLLDKGGWWLLLAVSIWYYFDKHPPSFVLWFREFVAYRKDRRMSDDERAEKKMASLHAQETLLTGIRSQMIERLEQTITKQAEKLDAVWKMVSDCHADSSEHRIKLAEQDGQIKILTQQNVSLATQNGVLMNTLDDMRKTLLIIEAVQRRHPELFNES